MTIYSYIALRRTIGKNDYNNEVSWAQLKASEAVPRSYTEIIVAL